MSSCYKLVNLLRYKQFNHRLALYDFDFLFNINTNNPQKLREVWDAHFEYILLKYKYGSDETIYILPSQSSATMYKFSHPVNLQQLTVFN